MHSWVRNLQVRTSSEKPLSLSTRSQIPDEDNDVSDSLMRNGTDMTGASSEQEISIHTRSNQETTDWFKDNLLKLAALVWVVVGLVVFTCCSHAKHRNFVSALYLVIQIITTVGYGDIPVRSSSMRLFMSFYIFIGNILTSLVITERLQAIVRSSHDVLKIQAISKMVSVDDDQQPPPSPDYSTFKRVMFALVLYLAFILAGTVYFGQFHKCSCPMGSDHQCRSGADISECIDSGGHERTLVDGFYMSVVTLTSVGFGDEVPQSVDGRLFASVWMLLGVASMANFCGEMARAIMIHNMNSLADKGISRDLFNIIDSDGSGHLSKFEFTTYMLVRYGLVSEEDLQTLLAEFDKFDKDKSGSLSYAEVDAHHGDRELRGTPSNLAAAAPPLVAEGRPVVEERTKHLGQVLVDCSRDRGPGLEMHRGRYAH